jgi:5-methylcytosine-specific restriction enzyme subunit McrC
MRFINFNRKQMWKLFQLFVMNFYRRRQTLYRVNAEHFNWLVLRPEIEQFSLPALETDMVLSGQISRIVLDTKFYSKPFDSRYDKLTVRSGHLNQMFAYMQNIEARDERRRRVDGVILYATSLGGPPQVWKMFGHNLKVAGVDLSQDWKDIEKNLRSAIGIG